MTEVSERHEKPLASQVASLATRVEELEARVERLEGSPPFPPYYGGLFYDDSKKPGVKKRLPDGEVIHRRDMLLNWLENIWPEVARPLLAAHSPDAVAAVFRPIVERENPRPEWQTRFLGNAPKLFDFLHSEKFRRKPPKKTFVDALNLPADDEKRKRAANRLPTRQIANAMAGVPCLEWRTSLDKCSQKPSPFPVATSADRYYRDLCGIPTTHDLVIDEIHPRGHH